MTKVLDAFMVKLPSLNVPQLLSIATEHQAQRSDLDAARARARQLLVESGRVDEFDRLIGQLIQWSGADGARSGVYTFTSPSRDLVLADVRARAVPALADAVLALLLETDLGRDTKEALLAAWNVARGGRDREHLGTQRGDDLRAR